MPIKAIYPEDEFDPESPPQLEAGDWEKTDAGWRLKGVEAVDGYGVGNTGKLDSALKKERTEAGRIKAELRNLQAVVGDDADLDEIKQLIEKGRSKTDPNTEEAIQKRITDATSKLAKEKNTEIETLKAEKAAESEKLQNQMGRTRLISELAAAGCEKPDVLAKLVSVRTRFEEDKQIDEVLGEDGQPQMDMETGEPMTYSALAKQWKSDEVYSRFFRGTGSSGSGADPAAARGGARPKAEFDPTKPMGQLIGDAMGSKI